MKALFVYDHRISCKNEIYYSPGSFPAKVWDRYLKHFDSITVVGRTWDIDGLNSDRLTVTSAPNVSFYCFDYLKGAKDYVRYDRRIRSDLKKVINEEECDAVIVRLPSQLGMHAISICREQRIPYAVEVVGCTLDAWRNYGKWRYRLLSRFAYLKMRRCVEKSVFVIYVTKNFLQQRYPVNSKAIKTCYASNVEIPPFNPKVLQNHIELLSNRYRVRKLGMIGNLDVRYKGFDVAINAFAKSKERIPESKLYIVGAGQGEHVKKLIKELGLDNDVILVGRLTSGQEVFDFLDTLDLYVHPSKTEGLPRALIEAMSRGCPCLASRVGGIPELLDEDFLHSPGNIEQLSSQMLSLLNNRGQLIKAGTKNYSIAKDYTTEVLSQRRFLFWDSFFHYAAAASKRKSTSVLGIN